MHEDPCLYLVESVYRATLHSSAVTDDNCTFSSGSSSFHYQIVHGTRGSLVFIQEGQRLCDCSSSRVVNDSSIGFCGYGNCHPAIDSLPLHVCVDCVWVRCCAYQECYWGSANGADIKYTTTRREDVCARGGSFHGATMSRCRSKSEKRHSCWLLTSSYGRSRWIARDASMPNGVFSSGLSGRSLNLSH